MKALPGRVLSGRVAGVAAMSSLGRLASGTIPKAPDGTIEPFVVMLEVAELEKVPELFGGGLAGVAAIYTDELAPTHAIRKILLRMQAWKNYVIAQ